MSAWCVWFDCKSKIVWLLDTVVCVDGSDGLLAGWRASLLHTDASQQLLEHLPWKSVAAVGWSPSERCCFTFLCSTTLSPNHLGFNTLVHDPTPAQRVTHISLLCWFHSCECCWRLLLYFNLDWIWMNNWRILTVNCEMFSALWNNTMKKDECNVFDFLLVVLFSNSKVLVHPIAHYKHIISSHSFL